MKKYKWWEEDAPTNATGPAVVGTGDDDSTVVVRKKPKVYRRKRKMTKEEIEEAKARNYRKEYDNYHAQPEQRERNAARLRARRQMEKLGKVKKFDKKDVHHKDNNPLNNEKDNLAVTTQNWNRSEPRLRKEELDEARFMELPNGKKIDITKLSLSQLSKLKGKKGLFKVDGNKLIPRENTKAWRKKAADEFGKYMGSKEEVEKSINIQERELTPNELKRREEIAQDLSDADFKKRYGDRWKEVKMGVATNMAKKESINEQDPKADKLKSTELKIAKAIAQAQLKVAKEQERIQKLTDLVKKKKDQAAEEKTMNNKYLKSKEGTLEEAVLNVWQDAAEEVGKLNVKQEGFSSSLVKKAVKIATDMGGDMTNAVKKIEKMKRGLSDDPAVVDALRLANEQKEESSKVDGRTKGYKEALRRIKMRQERMKAKLKSVTEESLEELYSVEYKFKSDKDAKAAATFVAKHASPGKLEIDVQDNFVDIYVVGGVSGSGGKELKRAHAEVEKYFKGKIVDTKVQKEEALEEKLKKGYFRMPNGEDVWVDSNPGVLPKAWAKKVEAGKIDATKMDFSGPPKKWKEIKASYDPELKEAQSGDKEAYKKFFDAALKKFGIDSPADLKSDEEKKKFYDYIDKGWEGDDEKKEAIEFNEKIEYVEYQFRNKNEAKAAKKFFDAQQRMEFEVNDDGVNQGLLSVDAGKNDMTEYHKAIVKKLKPKVISTENQKKK